MLYFTRLTVGDLENNEDLQFANAALIRLFSCPNEVSLRASYSALTSCQAIDRTIAINVYDIISVIAMVPRTCRLEEGELEEDFFIVEKPGLSVSNFVGGNGEPADEDDNGVDVEYLH